jgi:hypothetical protein
MTFLLLQYGVVVDDGDICVHMFVCVVCMNSCVHT